MFKCVFAAMFLGLAVVLMAGQGVAQSNGPAEAPPDGFAEAQFVDSRGCAFARAAINGQVRWVPRLGADRQPVCGLPPSLADTVRADDADTPDADTPLTADATPARTAEAEPAPTPETAAPNPQAPAPRAPQPGSPAAATPAPTAPPGPRPAGAPAAAVAPPLPESIPAGDMTGIPTVPCPAHYPQRGVICVERQVFQQIVAARAAGVALPDLTAPPGAGAQGRFVQVGAFAVPANAQRTVARLRARGLPPQSRRVHHRGRVLDLVFAGPFDGAEALQAALTTARAMGFADAYIRR